ncbi:MAG: hypothetical protein ACT4OT_15535 [Acidobacteriota bacterium]
MKRCPQCNRVETDEALKFCRVDGATLVIESSALGEAGTAQLWLPIGRQRSSDKHPSAHDERRHESPDSADDCTPCAAHAGHDERAQKAEPA